MPNVQVQTRLLCKLSRMQRNISYTFVFSTEKNKLEFTLRTIAHALGDNTRPLVVARHSQKRCAASAKRPVKSHADVSDVNRTEITPFNLALRDHRSGKTRHLTLRNSTGVPFFDGTRVHLPSGKPDSEKSGAVTTLSLTSDIGNPGTRLTIPRFQTPPLSTENSNETS
jgi:hypothetical protein